MWHLTPIMAMATTNSQLTYRTTSLRITRSLAEQKCCNKGHTEEAIPGLVEEVKM